MMATFKGTSAGETISGSFENDLIDGGGGLDTLVGGQGSDDYIWYGEPIIIVEEVDAGLDYVSTSIKFTTPYVLTENVDGFSITGEGQGHAIGNGLDNNFYGGRFADTFEGGVGEDKFFGNGGNDSMVGGANDDRYEVDSIGDIVVEGAGAGSGWDTVRTTLSSFTLNYANVEVLWYIGNGNFHGIGNELDNTLLGSGNIGNDTLDGAGGADILAGQGGDDTYIVDKFDRIDERFNDGIDTAITKGIGEYRLDAAVENLTQTSDENLAFIGHGNALNNVIRASNKASHQLFGYEGNDHLISGGSANTLDGGSGNDTLEGSAGASDVGKLSGKRSDYTILETKSKIVLNDKRGVDGTDTFLSVETFSFSDGQVTMSDLIGSPKPVDPVPPPGHPSPIPPAQPPGTPVPLQEVFTGDRGNNTIHGNEGKNVIKGFSGNDRLYGHEGSDKIYGGLGLDWLHGGSGKDKFVFDTKPSKNNIDQIRDFKKGEDTIWLDNADFTKVGKIKAMKASAFWSSKTGKAHDANDRVIYDKDSGVLYYDADGTGSKAGVAFATISKNLALTAKDFLIV
ncbi:calcium-binding protein [Microvirga aerilata]|uniref:Calcium-binding protein n=1 Tax=Microvirga aerilata TaxID=670292 RepID=A0A937D471_9HYPH|nr:calcium-binding protein [Microvirga aerilata]MBL0407205.1 calcium-binding protein [Microvirga aerilata]